MRDWDPRFNDARVAVVDLSNPRAPSTVGEWRDADDPICMQSLSRNKAGTRLYDMGIVPQPCGRKANRLHLYILDIQDPTQPVEIGRYVYPFPVDAVHSPYLAPNDDDTLLVLADGAWSVSARLMDTDPPSCGHHGRLHFLDISDLNAIHEVGTFKIEESDTCLGRVGSNHYQATDVAVKGNLVYSTWLKGGLHVVDVSDPADPVEVGEFRSPDNTGPWLSDVDLYSDPSGDYALASTVWWSGLYVVKLR